MSTQQFTCELCGKRAFSPNLILHKGTPMHIGCLASDWEGLRTAHRDLRATVRRIQVESNFDVEDGATELGSSLCNINNWATNALGSEMGVKP